MEKNPKYLTTRGYADQAYIDKLPQKAKEAFEALTSGEYKNFFLTRCTVNGEESAAICAWIPADHGGMTVLPLFVYATPNMSVVDTEGQEAHLATSGPTAQA